MAVTKILARKARMDVGINYVLNGDKTEDRILTAHLNCDPGRECRQMLETKRRYGKEDGVQYYHVIQAFKPGEVSPELALEIAQKFSEEHLPGHEVVIGVHVDKAHVHAHLVFNSVNADWVTSSCSWSTWDMRSITGTAWGSVCVGRSDLCIRGGKIRCSRRTVSGLLSKEIWKLSMRASGH